MMARVAPRIAILLALAAAGLSSPAQAVPCVPLFGAGITASSDCRNGPDGDASASEGELSGFFGVSQWTLLDSSANGTDSNFWSFAPSPNGSTAGLFWLADGIWDVYSDLVVVLNGRGGALDKDIKWSAYLLDALPHWLPYAWSYDYVNRLSEISLFGSPKSSTPPTVRVAEPSAVAMLVIGLALLPLALRRRLAAARRSI